MSPFPHISATLNSESQSTDTVEATNSMAPTHNKDLTAFFAIGMTINIIIVVTFIIWGFKQWNRK